IVPDWSDATSVYLWIQKYTLNRGRNRLVKTFGRDFEFLGRDRSMQTLWNGTDKRDGIMGRFLNRKYDDKIFHPIPVLAGGPGTGKSRFLDEAERFLKEYANSSGNQEIFNAFANMVVVNTTYGSGSAAEDLDTLVGGQSSLAIRILFEYFQPQYEDARFDYSSFSADCGKGNIGAFKLSTVLRIIQKDVMLMKQPTTSTTMVVVIGIDEFNNLHDFDRETARKLIHGIGSTMCLSPKDIFFVPILAGTIEGSLEQYIMGSMHKALHLPLPLLDQDDSMKISKVIKLDRKTLNDYILSNHYFQVCIGDIGGHVRTLEYFYEEVAKKLYEKKNNPDQIEIAVIMEIIRAKISDDYNLQLYSDWLTPALAKCILGIEVRNMDTISCVNETMTYQDVSSRGILNLEYSRYESGEMFKIRIPYLWMSELVAASVHPGMSFWKTMLNYDEPMHWQDFEGFNVKFLALRLSLFRLLGYSKIKLKEFLYGAIFSHSFPDVQVIIPENIQLCQMMHQYPPKAKKAINETVYSYHESENSNITNIFESDDSDMANTSELRVEHLENKDISKFKRHIFHNAPGAPWDLFEFLDIEKTDEKKKLTLLIAGQVKSISQKALHKNVIDDTSFKAKYKKAFDAKLKIKVDEWIFLLLSNAESKNLLMNNENNSAFVGLSEFQNFYGYTYSSRAQFAFANDKININSASYDSLKIVGLKERECKVICKKRKYSALKDVDDVKTILKLTKKRCNSLKKYW
ncbi:hypothetical protein BC937DRAFT_93571, partial [Endogone sp. FLAS-F59071]